MRVSKGEQLSRKSYPRLTVIILDGITSLAIGGTLAILDTINVFNFGLLSFRIGVVGYLLLAFGIEGNLANRVCRGQP